MKKRKGRNKDSGKDSSEIVIPEKHEETENEEVLLEEETLKIPEEEKIKTQKLKSSTFFNTSLFLLLIGVLSWTTYYLYNIIHNNFSKIEETAEEIHRIQAGQDKMKEAITSFQNNRNDLEEFSKAGSELNKKISLLQLEVNSKIEETAEEIHRTQAEQDKMREAITSFQNNRNNLEEFSKAGSELNKKISVLQLEVNSKIEETAEEIHRTQAEQDKMREAITSFQNNQSAKLEIKKEEATEEESEIMEESEVMEDTEEEEATKDESEIMEESEVMEEPEEEEESSKDMRNNVINLIEDTAETIFQKIGDAFKWIKEKFL